MSGSHRSGDSAVSLEGILQGRLAPVGEAIALRRETYSANKFAPGGWAVQFLNSGTAALSLAMSVAATIKPGAEVILPAYGCPDLLAAAHFAGLEPVLVDIQPDSPRYKLEGVRAAVNERTVALVAVNFLGIHEDLAELRALLEPHGCLLIEDDAQYFPLDGQAGSYAGDLVVHSFGRGKPISQIGGGALLVQEPLRVALQELQPRAKEGLVEWQWRCKAHLFNLVLRPQVYQLLESLPFLHVGETRYHPLENIWSMDYWRLDYIAANIATYRCRSRSVQEAIDGRLQSSSGDLINLPRLLGCLQQPLLRYPILCENPQRKQALFQELQRAGLGVSRMYEQPLAAVQGIPPVPRADYCGASQFSRSLLTLPTNSFVDAARLNKMLRILSDNAG